MAENEQARSNSRVKLVPGAGSEIHIPALHPAWSAFVRYCGELKHGEIERLSIQDGLPVLAETTKKKVKFT